MKTALDFASYRFVPSTGQLFAEGKEVRLTPKAAAVLTELIVHAGQPVTKEQLFASVWPETVVTDDALTSCVMELRRALGDDPKHPRFIETRHRRGYRFMPPIAESPLSRPADSGPPEPAPAIRMEGKPTVALLPFENVSGDAGQDYFSDGVTGDLITALSKHRSILVLARASTVALKGYRGDIRELGVKLGADYILEGSVANTGTRLRVSARLIETQGGGHVWAERYDREVTDIFAVQDAITMTIAARIEPEVGIAERRRTARRSLPNLGAWDLFQLGQKHFYLATPHDNVEAQRLFRRALETDPAMAAAYAWLSYAIVLGMLYFDAEPDNQRLDEAVALARRGVELDDQDAFTHFGYGRALLARKAYEDALAELQCALDLNPNLAIVHCGLGDSLAYEGRFGDAIPYFEKAIGLSPYDPQRWAFYSYRALAHLLAGEFHAAVEWSTKATRVPHCHYWPFGHRVAALGHLGDTEPLTQAKAELLERQPAFSCGFARHRLFYIRNPVHLDLYVAGLRKAGIPD